MTYKMAPSSRTMEQNISTDSKAKLNGNIRSSLTDREIRRDYDEVRLILLTVVTYNFYFKN